MGHRALSFHVVYEQSMKDFLTPEGQIALRRPMVSRIFTHAIQRKEIWGRHHLRRQPCCPRKAPAEIERIEAIPYSIPDSKPLEFASGRATDAGHVLIRVLTDDRIVDVADALPRPFT
jgi:hypothetical protein